MLYEAAFAVDWSSLVLQAEREAMRRRHRGVAHWLMLREDVREFVAPCLSSKYVINDPPDFAAAAAAQALAALVASVNSNASSSSSSSSALVVPSTPIRGQPSELESKSSGRRRPSSIAAMEIDSTPPASASTDGFHASSSAASGSGWTPMPLTVNTSGSLSTSASSSSSSSSSSNALSVRPQSAGGFQLPLYRPGQRLLRWLSDWTRFLKIGRAHV